MPDTEPIERLQCNECSAGVMHLQMITYFTWLGDELITVPNFPAWICDVCGRREYDQKARIWLTALLNPESGKKVSRKRMPTTPPKPHGPRPATE
ncbi:MAG: YgiT-type zinc finger protein [Anaerolineales bacterium]|jgi:YgiT-type zinc finger domain-containing protein